MIEIMLRIKDAFDFLIGAFSLDFVSFALMDFISSPLFLIFWLPLVEILPVDLGRRNGGGKGDHKCRSLAGKTANGNVAAAKSHDTLNNGQTNAVSVTCVRGVALVEFLENMTGYILAHAHTRVGYGHGHDPLGLPKGTADRTVSGRKLKGISEKV